MDLSKLSDRELKRLSSSIKKETAKRTERSRKDVLKQMKSLAAKQGFTFDEIVSGTAKKAAKQPVRRRKAPIKYRDTSDPANAWSGRGRRPRWMEAAIKKGAKQEDFRV